MRILIILLALLLPYNDTFTVVTGPDTATPNKRIDVAISVNAPIRTVFITSDEVIIDPSVIQGGRGPCSGVAGGARCSVVQGSGLLVKLVPHPTNPACGSALHITIAPSDVPTDTARLDVAIPYNPQRVCATRVFFPMVQN